MRQLKPLLMLLVLAISVFCVGCGDKSTAEENNTKPTAANPNAVPGMEAGKNIDMRLGQKKTAGGK
jgi:hypothetical protein